jgi:hypothetical protein
MRRVFAASVASLAAALVLAAVPAGAQPAPGSFDVTPTNVRAGQWVTASGQGCEARAFVDIFLDGAPFARARADLQGKFVKRLRLPIFLAPGTHQFRAECSNSDLGTVAIEVEQPQFEVTPTQVAPGDFIVVSGTGCPVRSRVIISLDGLRRGSTRSDVDGAFSRRVRIPPKTSPGTHTVSVSCGGRSIGTRVIEVSGVYPPVPSAVNVSRSVVQAGRTVAVRGKNCPTGAPVAALDGQKLAVNVAKGSQGKGFSGTVTIPRGTAPGKHNLQTACEAGSAGTTELQVLDSATTESAAEQQPFGNQSSANLAIWAGVLVGIALLAASVRIGRRRT